jgi:hypothetical protein
MTFTTNFAFSITHKTTLNQIRDLEKEEIHLDAGDIGFMAAQVLLNLNKYLYIGDPIGELSKYFWVTKSRFTQAIEVRKKAMATMPCKMS